MHIEGIWLVLFMVVLHMSRSVAASNGKPSLLFSSEKPENNNEMPYGKRALPSIMEVQYDIIMYWTTRYLGDSEIYLTLKGLNYQSERIHLQNTTGMSFGRLFRATTLVYRVMIKPVQGLSSVLVYSNETLPNFDKILIVRNGRIVYEFFALTNLADGTSKEANLVYGEFYQPEYPAVSIRFTKRGMCMNPIDSALPPPVKTPLVLRYTCGTLDSFFTIAEDNTIRHIASGLCVDGNVNGSGGIPVDGGGGGEGLTQSHVVPVRVGNGRQSHSEDELSDTEVGTANDNDDFGSDNTQSKLEMPGDGGYSRLASTSQGKVVSTVDDDDNGDDKLASTNQGPHGKVVSTVDRVSKIAITSQDPYGRVVSTVDGDDGVGVSKLASTGQGPLGRVVSTVNGDDGNYDKLPITGNGGHGRVNGGQSKLVSTGNTGNEGEVTDTSEGNDMKQNEFRVNGKLTSRWSRLKKYPEKYQSAIYHTFEGSRRYLNRGLYRSSSYPRQRAVHHTFKSSRGDIKHRPQYTTHSYSHYNPSRPVIAYALLNDHEEEQRNVISEIPGTLANYVHLFLGQNCTLKFHYTTESGLPLIQSTDTNGQGGNVLTEGGRPTGDVRYRNLRTHVHLRKRNLRRLGGRYQGDEFKRQEVLHSLASNKRALTTDLKYILQENETGLCIGYVNKQIVLMPCQSVPSSVEFYGKAGNTYTAQNKEQLRKPITSDIETENITINVSQAQPNNAGIPFTTATPVVSQCGNSCPSTCYPSCTSSCCNTGVSFTPNNIEKCGGSCPSSCFPSCTSSCCDTGSPNYQEMLSPSSQSVCPSGCDSSNQICPSSQCPQTCCPDQGGSYSYMSQSQMCPLGCKKHCRPSCPFNCC